jgi:hypothetical protein
VRTVLRLVSVVVLVVFCLAVWVGIRAWLAKDHLENAADEVQQLQTQVERGQTKPAGATLTRLQGETKDAVRLTGDPVWRAAQHIPVVGDDLRAIHLVSVAGHTVSMDSLPPLVKAAADVGSVSSTDGGLSPAQLLAAARRLQVPLTTAQAGVTRAQAQIATIDAAHLFSPVRSGVNQLSSGLHTLDVELTALLTADKAALKAAAALGGG